MTNRIFAGIFAVLSVLLPTGASAIQKASVPPKFPIVWGAAAATPYIRSIPQLSQIGITNCAASLTDGFPPLTFVPASAGGCPPFGQDFNGIFKQVSQWSQWFSAGAPIFYDATFAGGASNGYPSGAVVQSTVVAGDFWLSTADDNTTNPDAGGAGWVPLPGMAQTGTISWTVTATIPTGWVVAKNNYTIGSAASVATYASADAQFLFAWHWNNFSNTQCPVSGGRGANAAADFAANKTIQVIDLAGTGLIGNDNSTGRLASVPIVSGSIVAPGSVIGENLHQLVVAEIPSHTHSGTTSVESANHTHGGSGTTGNDSPDHAHTGNLVSGPSSSGITAAGVASSLVNGNTGGATNRHTHSYSFTTGTESAGHTHAITTDGGTGGNGSHNNVERSMIVNWMLKL